MSRWTHHCRQFLFLPVGWSLIHEEAYSQGNLGLYLSFVDVDYYVIQVLEGSHAEAAELLYKVRYALECYFIMSELRR